MYVYSEENGNKRFENYSTPVPILVNCVFSQIFVAANIRK